MSASKASGITFLFGITTLLCFQLLGELCVRLLKLPLPGPVAGLVFLLIALALLNRSNHTKKEQTINTIDQSASTLLNHLSLLFVPAGVGIMVHFDKLSQEWLPIAIALIVGALITLITTALCMKLVISIMKIDTAEQKTEQGD